MCDSASYQIEKQPVANAEKLKQQIPSIKYFILLDRYAEIIMDQGLAPAKGIDASNRSFSSERKAKSDRKLFGLISEIFTPIIPLFAGSGILKGLVVLATTIGWLSETSGTYHILSAASNAVFYFLPIFLAFLPPKRLK